MTLESDSLSYQVEKALQYSGNNYRPLEGKDYTISTRQPFDGGKWIVVSVEPIDNSMNTESMVFKQSGSSYSLAYGPSNFFQGSNFDNLPGDIKNYLINK